MSRVRQLLFCLAAVAVAVASPAQPAKPVPLILATTRNNTNLPPLPPTPQSPVSFFRQLLLMPPAERNRLLTNRTPASRAILLAKIREYQGLDPNVRELRLRATELRWYLVPLLRTPAADRNLQLDQVPPELREIVQARLTEWDLLPPPLQQEFLASDRSLQLLVQTSPPSPDPQQQKIADQFDQFLKLTPTEEQKLLGTLSEVERTKMEQTLKSFAQLPPQQRALCLRNYAKFAGMSVTERAEFLKNAESWSRMSPQERQSWRDLVAHAPLWPPMPLSIMPPPLPHALPKVSKPGVATN